MPHLSKKPESPGIRPHCPEDQKLNFWKVSGIAGLTVPYNVSTRTYMKVTKLFRSGGSYAVRIPRSWVPASHEVVLRREGDQIVISEAGRNLRDLARSFAEDGLIDLSRPEQPESPQAKQL